MGSGLSMTSVNKIKELASAREYSLAEDILDSQDLSKSLNPQFLLLCGNIYTNVGRYKDARRLYLMSHRLSPEGKRAIASLAFLYMRLGYRDLVEKYREIYMHDADPTNLETKQFEYNYSKYMNESIDEIGSHILPTFVHTIDYDWSYETILVLLLQGKKEDAEILISDYKATFKDSKNSSKLDKIVNNPDLLDEEFYIYSKEDNVDDDPEHEPLRDQEELLLHNDELRIHPPEAQIMIMVDDNDPEDAVSKRKLKKFLKEEANKQSDADGLQDSNSEAKSGLFKKLFSKKKNDDQETLEEQSSTDEVAEENQIPETVEEIEEPKENIEPEAFEESEEIEEPEEPEEFEEPEEIEESEELEELEEPEEIEEPEELEELEEPEEIEESEELEELEEPEEIEKSEELEEFEELEQFENFDDQSNESDISSFEDEEESIEEVFAMREIHLDKHTQNNRATVSVDFGDDFTPEAETVEALHDLDYSNPFDSLNNQKSKSKFKLKGSSDFSFEDADLSESDDDFYFDDFTPEEEKEFDDVSGRLNGREQAEEYQSDFTEEEVVEEYKSEPRPSLEELWGDGTDVYEGEIDGSYDEEQPEEEEVIEEEEPAYEEEPEEEEVVEEEEPTYEEEPEEEEVVEEEEPTYEEEPEEEEVIEEEEPTYEEEPEEEEVVEEEEPTFEEKPEEEEVVEEEPEIIKAEPVKRDYFDIDKTIQDGNYDFPVFKSSLFPEYNNNVPEIQNNFNEVMNEEQKRIKENLLKEEQMQREAEALLASLGIDLGSITPSNQPLEDINETLFGGLKREDLMKALVIDDGKKDILKKLKEYR